MSVFSVFITFTIDYRNPMVSSQFIKTKMVGRQAISVCKVKHHLLHGEKTTDWVFAGVVVNKSATKTSKSVRIQFLFFSFIYFNKRSILYMYVIFK